MLASPAEFRAGVRHPAGTAWRIPAAGPDEPEMHWPRNPRLVLPPAYLHAVRLYWRHRGGMAPGPLPDAGGVNDQAAWLMAAFGILGGIEAAQQPEGERP